MGLFGLLRCSSRTRGHGRRRALAGRRRRRARRVLAPLTIGAAVAARLLPRAPAGRGRRSALVVLRTVTVTAIPVLGPWGARPDNPTLLDRNYVAGWCGSAPGAAGGWSG